MTSEYRRPPLPSDVARTLRQESGFGCARCGHPYIEYHHIVPFSEEAHFRPDDMVALCGNCHTAVSKLGLDRQYEIKNRPFNRERGFFRGALEYDKRNLIFKVGGCWYEDIETILQFESVPIIECKIKENQASVSANLFGPNGDLVLKIIDNEVIFRINEMWDFQYSHNFAVARYARRKIALKLDFRKSDCTIEGNIWLGGQLYVLGPDQTTLPGNNVMRGCTVSACRVGIQIGDPSQEQAKNFVSHISRNAACPCGSKLRFKRCCGAI